MASDIKLDIDTHDIAFESGKMTMTSSISESVAQRLKIKLLMFQGEWKFNIDFGIPYYQRIFTKGTTKPVVDSIFSQAITSTPQVTTLTSYNSTTTNATRDYSATFSVVSEDGSEFTLSI